ncbi:MAG: STT3 domain-containing protein, partial [Candidatus Micrarchaeota archaeon]
MFVSFNLLTFLAWVFISTFLPGMVLSFGILRKEASLSGLEKALIGCALGFFLLPMIPFLLYLGLGIKFSHMVATVSVVALYAVSIICFFFSRAYEGFKLPQNFKLPQKITFKPEHALPAALAVLLVLTFLIRIGSYGPVFQELDPYYYTYPAYQLISAGENIFDDQTSWYPEVVVNHRIIPALSYLEATWYSLYSGGAPADNMLLATIASVYPPIAAVLAVFFAYLLVSLISKREWGLLAGGLASFAPIFIYKLAAGEQEVQPYAFFALFFFYAMYALALKKKDYLTIQDGKPVFSNDLIIPVLAGIAYAALTLGSSTPVLVVMSVVLFVAFQAAALFLRDEDGNGLLDLVVVNAVILLIGPILANSVLQSIFSGGGLSFGYSLTYLAGVIAAATLYAMKFFFKGRASSAVVLCGIAIIVLLAVAFTPLGDLIKGPAQRGFGIAQYNAPLDRTIA